LNGATSSYVTETESGSFLITASFNNGTRDLTFTKGDNTTFAVNIPDVSGSTINTGSFITTGSASTGSQTILGDFNFDTTYTAVEPVVNQAGGTNILGIDYGAFNDIINYWGGLNFVGVLVNGTGVTNASISSYNFGSYLECTLSSGTTTNGLTYTLTGPVIQTISLTGSLESSYEIRARDTSTGQRAVMDVRGFYSQNADSSVQAGASTDGGVYTSLNTDTFNNIRLAVTSSQVKDNNGNPTPFNKPQIAVGQNNSGSVTQISFEGNGDYTNGTITVHQPLFVSSSLNVRNTFTASLQNGYIWVGNGSNVSSLLSTSSFITESETGSFLLTASFDNGTRNLTFTKGNNTTFAVNIPDVSGSVINTGSFAITGSNTFVGNQTISGSLIQSSSNSIPAGPGGTGVGTWIQNRVLISDISGALPPRLYISGSDGAYSEFGRGFITQDTSRTPGLGAFIYTAGPTDTMNFNTVAAITPDYSTDVEIQMFASTSSVGLADWDNVSAFNYIPFMELAPNNGDNPAPQFKRSIAVTGSVSITNVMNLKAQNPLPTGTIGDLAVSGSSLYFYNGAWTLVV
jgi:hypothetical protein